MITRCVGYVRLTAECRLRRPPPKRSKPRSHRSRRTKSDDFSAPRRPTAVRSVTPSTPTVPHRRRSTILRPITTCPHVRRTHSNSASHDFDAEELVEDYPVRFTNRGWHRDHSPDRAHEFCCGHVGHRDSDEFRCTNESCWVTEYHAELNAAVNIAGCLDPWGESLPWKSAGDDFPRECM